MLNIKMRLYMTIKKIALVSCFLDEGDDIILNDYYMEKFICNDDHFYHRIAKSLTMQGLEPVLFFPSTIKQNKTFQHKYGHSIVRINAKKIPFFHEPIVYSPMLIKKIQEFDICHFVSGYYIMYKIPDLFDYCVSKIHNKIPIVTRWSGGNYRWLFPIRKTIKKKSLQRCNQIICSGKDETTTLQTVFKIPKNNIKFLMNPIDLTKFKKRDKVEISTKLKLDPKFDYLLFVGRLVKSKGIENILLVFSEIQKKLNNTKLIIIGNGPLSIEINENIKKNNLEESVFLKEHMSHDEICFYYNIATVLINTGMSGGLPNVVIEAIASKLPVIATNVGATKDFINSDTGILIGINDQQALKLAIIDILTTNKKFNQTKQNIFEQFSYENFGKKLVEIYKNANLSFNNEE